MKTDAAAQLIRPAAGLTQNVAKSTASIGLASITAADRDISDLLKRADSAAIPS